MRTREISGIEKDVTSRKIVAHDFKDDAEVAYNDFIIRFRFSEETYILSDCNTEDISKLPNQGS
jgi:hypothetical protein